MSVAPLSEQERTRVAHIEELARAGANGVAQLVARLTEPSWVVRRSVVAALARVGAPAVEPLRAILESDRNDETKLAATVDALSASTADVDVPMLALARAADPAVVCDAIQVLGRRRSRTALPRVIELSIHGDDNVAVSAIEALGRIGGVEVVDALIVAAEAKHFFRTFPALDALGRTGDVRAVKTLGALLADPLYAAEAARALGRTGQERAVAPLAKLLMRPSDALVRTAVVALAELRERYEARFGDTLTMTESLRSEVEPTAAAQRVIAAMPGIGTAEAVASARVFAWLGDEASIMALIEMVTQPDPIGASAAEGLRRLGPVATPQLVAAIANSDSATRSRLLPTLGSGTGIGPVLVPCLADPDPDVRARTCEALARLGDTSVVSELFRLIGDRDVRVSQSAAAAIQSLGSRETKRLALEQSRATDARTRRAALRILSYFGYPEGLEILVAAMSDEDEKIRDAAIYGLPLIDDPRATDALLGSARHPDPKTRAAVARALGQTSATSSVIEALCAGLEDDDAWVRYYATQSLGRLKAKEVTPSVIARMKDASGQVRVAAVEALAHFGDVRAEEALAEAARSSDPDMQRAALLGLGISRRPAVIPLLREGAIAPDAATRLVAIGALAELDAPEVVPALAHAVSDPDEAVSAAAIGYLATRPTDDATLALLARLSSPAIRDRILDALAVGADQRVEVILQALETTDAEGSMSYVAALVRMRRPSSQAALATTLASDNVHARRAAASALAALSTAEAREALVRAGTTDPDPDVRRICATVLLAT